MLPEASQAGRPEPDWEQERRTLNKVRIEALEPQFRECRGAFIDQYLHRAGVAPFERTAEWTRVPGTIKKSFPTEWKSFGLVGGFGIGKTFTVAAALRRLAARRIDDHMERLIQTGEPYTVEQAISQRALALSPWALWVNWPGDIAKARGQLYEDGQGVETWILSLMDPSRLLILDDIGADRLAGNDWGGEVLARVIDDRLRNQGMTVWTSNLDTKALVERYGPRTYSRLQALAPMIVLPAMPDLRLQRQRGGA